MDDKNVEQADGGGKRGAGRVRMRQTVRGLVFPDDAPSVAAEGEVYETTLNPQGAVCAIVDGTPLGIKPGEFDFIDTGIGGGVTSLRRGGWHVFPRNQSDQRRAVLELNGGRWRWVVLEVVSS